ncbi:MAG: ERF family protein [Candidatus Saccharimonadaceae bacterium]|nr:ERF family protein [Candidatus Saccharimonadaceae bacterium]
MDGKQIVKSESKAYGYNYASLADIVNQGFKLPTMETRNIDGETFMGWLDDKGEWHQGAPLIVPEMKGMNAAQAMGSALTYARRYTAQMALGLACDDDAKLEKTKGAPEPTGKVYGNRVDFNKIKQEIEAIQSADELVKYWMKLSLSDKQATILKPAFIKKKQELEA